MKKIYTVIISFILLFFFQHTALSKITISVIGKTKNASFYKDSYKGCLAFAKKQTDEDIECLYDGPIDYQNARTQAHIVRSYIKKNVDGILVSTTESKFLVERALKHAKEKNIPVITFDSDLLPEHQQYRLAYVGTNNFQFGVALGTYAKKFKKTGLNEICIQSGSKTTPNLNERINGVRFALSGDHSNSRLQGKNGWVEHKRCPLYTLGKKPRALLQLEFVTSLTKPPLFLTVAGFAQSSPYYIEKMTPYKARIETNDFVIISADT